MLGLYIALYLLMGSGVLRTILWNATMDKIKKFDENYVCALVIDDDVTTRTILSKLLSAMGAARVLEAADGLEGLRIAFGDLTPDLIICDLSMEPLDGLAVIGAIRCTSKPQVAKIPLVVFTASRDEAILRATLAAGATGAIPKPHNPRDMSEYLCAIAQKHPRAADKLNEFRAAAQIKQ